MDYGKLPEGYTQVMNLKIGDVVELPDGNWRVEGLGYGNMIVVLEIGRGDERSSLEVHPNALIKLVSSTKPNESKP